MGDDKETTEYNFLRSFRDKDTRKLRKLTAAQFSEVWEHYDTDGSGYIEAEELDTFLREFIESVVPERVGQSVISEAAYSVLKQEFMDAYDENGDNRIEIGELATMLPMEEEFLLCFRREAPLANSLDFMRTWKRFDSDKSGYIESDELHDFMKHFLTVELGLSISEEKLREYADHILRLFDKNKDGRLQLSEMARLLPVKENFLVKPLFKRVARLCNYEIDRIFKKYDHDRSGHIDNDEILALLRDILEITGEEYDEKSLLELRRIILEHWDVDQDGRISRDELRMLLVEQKRLAVEQETFNNMMKAQT